MGEVIRQLEFNNKNEMKQFLEDEFSFSLSLKEGESIYHNQELKSILVNLSLEYKEDKLKLNIIKLVTLKAFLLSKDQDMDIVDLIFNIDKTMKMSLNGVKKSEAGILDDQNLKEFLNLAKIKVDEITKEKVLLSDNKRQVSVEYKDCSYDFNTIEIIKEF